MSYPVIYLAYEGDDLIGKFDTRQEASDAIEAAKRAASEDIRRYRVYRVETRRRRGGE